MAILNKMDREKKQLEKMYTLKLEDKDLVIYKKAKSLLFLTRIGCL